MGRLYQILGVAVAVFISSSVMATAASAQTADLPATSSAATTSEEAVAVPLPSESIRLDEAKGGVIWNDLQAKKLECSGLTDEGYRLLGQYIMGLRLDEAHEPMDEMMKRMLGETGEARMHIALGQRVSGCFARPVYPANGSQFLPLMGMMGDFWEQQIGHAGNVCHKKIKYNPMMNYGYQTYGFFGPVFMVLFWIVIIFSVIALIRWAVGQPKDGELKKDKDALEILKERYAKGEIDKKEFEEKKKGLMS